MKTRADLITLTIIFTVPLASCVTAPSHAPQPVPSGYLYEGSYINVLAPNSDGWYLINSNPSRMEFARSGREPNESYAAQVIMFPLPKTENGQEFLSLIKNGFENDTDQTRFEIQESNYQYTEVRGYPCVELHYVVKDKQAQTSPTHRESLLLRAESLYCRHPVRQNTGFSIIYSHRGVSLSSSFDAEAQEFINGVQVPGHEYGG